MVAAGTNRSETLTTGRPFSSEVRSFPSARSPRIWLSAGAVVVLLIGATVLALRSTHGPTVATQPEAAPPAITAPIVPPVVGLVAADNVHAMPEPPVTAPAAQLAVSAHIDTKNSKPGKTTKPGSKTPITPAHTTVEPAHPPATPEPPPTAPQSGDPFDRRH
jgi:hypothetical protein